MKNLHKVALSIAVGAFAIVFSAFKTAEDNKKTTTASVFYVLTSANQYTRVTGSIPSEGGCADEANHKCIIGYNEDRGTALDANDLPAAPPFESDSNGLWSNP